MWRRPMMWHTPLIIWKATSVLMSLPAGSMATWTLGGVGPGAGGSLSPPPECSSIRLAVDRRGSTCSACRRKALRAWKSSFMVVGLLYVFVEVANLLICLDVVGQGVEDVTAEEFEDVFRGFAEKPVFDKLD